MLLMKKGLSVTLQSCFNGRSLNGFHSSSKSWAHIAGGIGRCDDTELTDVGQHCQNRYSTWCISTIAMLVFYMAYTNGDARLHGCSWCFHCPQDSQGSATYDARCSASSVHSVGITTQLMFVVDNDCIGHSKGNTVIFLAWTVSPWIEDCQDTAQPLGLDNGQSY